MNCDYCNKPATVFLSQIVSEKQIQKVHLCETCAKNEDIIQSEGLEHMLNTEKNSRVTSTKQCPECHFTLQDLSNTGRLGCSACYTTFFDEISQRLESLHRGSSHTGKAPDVKNAKKQLKKKTEELEKRLAKAISEEAFEEAAALRDQINHVTD